MASQWPKTDKRYAMRAHSIRRLREHYKLRADEELYHKFCKYIRESQGKSKEFDDGVKTEFVDKQSNTRSAWKIYWNDLCLIAAFDKTRKIIATFLPSDLSNDEIQYKRWMLEEETIEDEESISD
jgi:hypothetical protein